MTKCRLSLCIGAIALLIPIATIFKTLFIENIDVANDMASRQITHLLRGNASRAAIVIGATGATGSQVLAQLLDSDEWGKVTTFGRRELDVKHSKLNHHIVSLDNLEPSKDAWIGHDVVFHCLGTTRSQAGGADGFLNIEVEMTRNVAKMAKLAGIPAFSLITSQGANPDQYYVKWIHPLLYLYTMGQKELAVKEQNFLRTTIFRPGMLNRLQSDRALEKVALTFLNGLRVDNLAKAMIRDAESDVPTDIEPPRVIQGNDNIMATLEE
eukprot:m.340194 g.340194  ORF g.340194 m.340194 type:complete len:268 (+) comp19178_c0_seq1:406-1209(+)